MFPVKEQDKQSMLFYFHELDFEKADFKRDQSGSRKRAIVSGTSKGYCATPEFAKQIKKS